MVRLGPEVGANPADSFVQWYSVFCKLMSLLLALSCALIFVLFCMRMALVGAETCGELVWVMIFTYLRNYLLTPWSRVLHEKLTGFQPVKKFPAFYGTRRFITAFTSAHHLSLSLASSIQPIAPHPTS